MDEMTEEEKEFAKHEHMPQPPMTEAERQELKQHERRKHEIWQESEREKENLRSKYFDGDSQCLAYINYLIGAKNNNYPYPQKRTVYGIAFNRLVAYGIFYIPNIRPYILVLTKEGVYLSSLLRKALLDISRFREAIGDVLYEVETFPPPFDDSYCISKFLPEDWQEVLASEVQQYNKIDNPSLHTIRYLLADANLKIRTQADLNAHDIKKRDPILHANFTALKVNLQPLLGNILSEIAPPDMAMTVGVINDSLEKYDIPRAVAAINACITNKPLSGVIPSGTSELFAIQADHVTHNKVDKSLQESHPSGFKNPSVLYRLGEAAEKLGMKDGDPTQRLRERIRAAELEPLEKQLATRPDENSRKWWFNRDYDDEIKKLEPIYPHLK